MSFFYIVSFLFDALGPAVHKLAYSLQEEGFQLVAQPFMHRFPHFFVRRKSATL